MVSKKIWIITVVVVLMLVAGILLLRFTSSQGKNYMGEDAAQFATDFDFRSYR